MTQQILKYCILKNSINQDLQKWNNLSQIIFIELM